MDFKRDVIPVTELKAHTKEVLMRVGRTGEPVLITQNGHSAALIVDVEAYQAQQRKLHIYEEIAKGERDIAVGRSLSGAEVRRRVKDWLR